jgi:hypothetical protein
MIVEKTLIAGTGKGAKGWMDIHGATVSYDHPFNVSSPANSMGYAVNIDFVNDGEGLGSRIAVELTVDSALRLMDAINSCLEQGRQGGHLEEKL